MLYRLLNLKPPKFYHFPLLLDASGRRLSKRDGDIGLEALRSRCSPEEVIGVLAYLAGLNPSRQPCTPESLIDAFSWDLVPTEDICLPTDLF